MQLRRLALVLGLALCTLELAACTTTGDRSSKKSTATKRQKNEASKAWGKANFALHDGNIDQKFLRRGRKAMGGSALDSY